MSGPRVGRHQATARRLLAPLARRLWRFEVDGLHNVPERGPAILCPNHLAAIDSFVLPAMLERDVTFVGKAEYLGDWKTRWLLPALGMIPVDRRGGSHAKPALDAAREVLERGGLFAIYPEGTRSRTGRLHKGHTGAARLAVETGAPIIPVGLTGTADIQPVDTTMPHFFRRVGIVFGEPIEVDRYRARVGDRAIYRELTDEIMYEIRELTGQEYEPAYAGSDKPQPDDGPVAVDGPTATIERLPSSAVLTSDPLIPLADLLAAS